MIATSHPRDSSMRTDPNIHPSCLTVFLTHINKIFQHSTRLNRFARVASDTAHSLLRVTLTSLELTRQPTLRNFITAVNDLSFLASRPHILGFLGRWRRQTDVFAHDLSILAARYQAHPLPGHDSKTCAIASSTSRRTCLYSAMRRPIRRDRLYRHAKGLKRADALPVPASC